MSWNSSTMIERNRSCSASLIARVLLEERPRAQLQVLEVERRLTILRVAVRLAERSQQLLQELTIARGELLEGDRPDGRASLAEGCGPRAARSPGRKLDQAFREERRRLEEVEDVVCGVPLQLGRLVVCQECLGLGPEHCQRVVQALARPGLERQLSAGRAERVVHADEHLAQPGRPVGREQLPAIWLVDAAELLQCCVERLALEHPRLRLVEDPEPGIDAGCERIRGEQAAAEAVDRGDPAGVEVTCEIAPPGLEQPCADPRAQLAGGPVRVRDDEQGVDVEAVVEHGAGEPLDEHGRLARARARGDERRPARVDGGLLLLVEGGRHGRSFRHMRQRSHQAGQSPPWGSCLMSPARIRSASPTATPRACSISASKSGPSR